MTDLDWDKTGRRFYLLDTFSGLAERYVSVEEKNGCARTQPARTDSGSYTKNVEAVRANFAEWKNVCIMSARIPKLWTKSTPWASPFYIST